MNGRGGVVTFFLFLFLSVIVLLQILLMVQSDRFYDGLNRLDKAFESGTIATRPKGLEPSTFGSTVRCSSQLSYGPIISNGKNNIPVHLFMSTVFIRSRLIRLKIDNSRIANQLIIVYPSTDRLCNLACM